MKKDFYNKWKNDKKYRSKIKLSLYAIFIILVTIYASSLNTNIIVDNSESTIDNNIDNETTNNYIDIPDNYTCKITVNIDDKSVDYILNKLDNKTTLSKTIDDISTSYLYQNNEYYIEDNDMYLKTTKDEVYDIVNYNYINFNSINSYLSKAKKDNNQFLVYLKDIVLGNDTEDYFVILMDDNQINIDYTPLVKLFNNNIEKYKVRMIIEEYKEVN